MGEKTKELDNLDFKIWCSERDRSRNGLGIIVDKVWKKHIVYVKRKGD